MDNRVVNIMKLSICRQLIKAVKTTLISVITLYGATSLIPAYGGIHPGLESEFCMADAYLLEDGNKLVGSPPALNCTANDVEITAVVPVNASEECTLGQTFSFPADVTVRTNANDRWDITFYLPLTEVSPQVVHNPATKEDCSILLPIPADSGETADVNLDGDACGDITKSMGPDEYTLYNQSITMLCADEDGDNRADFNYCAAWDNIERDNCSLDGPYPGQIPNNKSKCNCDTFNIDVFITPEPPEIIKTLVGTNTHAEPGGVYTFDVSFDNPNEHTSIFLTSLVDEVDIFADGTYNVALDLWGALDVPAGEGVYLTASNCGALLSGGQIEIVPSGSFSCRFEVTIVDSDLPDDQSPELYDDTVRLSLKDKNGDDVTNGETCPADLAGTSGKFCSNVVRVQVTNLPPDISVVKTADKEEVLEPGENVEFTISVTNNSDAWDSPINLDSLNDSIYGDLNGKGDCAINVSIAQGATYSCSFTEFVAGDQGQSFTNTVTAVGSDNEDDTDTAQDSHTVLVLDVPSNIDLDKTANPTSVLETGDDTSIFRDVRFTFVISVDAAGVDDVTFSSLTDTVFGDITTDCNFGTVAAPQFLLPGLTLSPGGSDTCFIDRGLQGYDEDTHFNKATVHGTDSDGAALMAMDDATVEFDPSAPASDMDFATSQLVVLVMHNAGLENVNLSALTVQGNAIVDGVDYGQYTIRNSAGGSHAGVSYPACNIGEPLGYNGSATDTYSCAFTIELQPGIENADDINFSAAIGNGIIATFMNAGGETTSNAVGVAVLTDEP